MAATTGVRTFHAAAIPPGPAHVNGVQTLGANPKLAIHIAGFWSSLPVDFLCKAAGIANFFPAFVEGLPLVLNHALTDELLQRSARLICLTEAYAEAYKLSTKEKWTSASVVRHAAGRRAVQIEIDSIVAIQLGLTVDELCTIYRTQFPVLLGYELNDLYDANGRKVPGDINRLYRKLGESMTLEDRTWTHPQSDVEYVFEFPFQSFDREEDMRKAYAHFSGLLEEKA